ncbi:hypothetical protein [Mycoplasma sp. E35C]|uniref:hypothetical protein n=1 Tax=Mycoplasma sp. E35C TaxID=2801918 RepID=UPI001CA3B047|nr:hypothetical protein [Mycoplasma sp. E35C]QZX49346.1 hypothetical protein JJE79_01180 [Mycoplasma sp. E35C]
MKKTETKKSLAQKVDDKKVSVHTLEERKISKQLYQTYLEWFESIKDLNNPNEINKISNQYGKQIMEINRKISLFSLKHKNKRLDVSKYTSPVIAKINNILKPKLKKNSYDYILQVRTRFEFSQSEKVFSFNENLKTLEKILIPKLISNEYKDKSCYPFLLAHYSKEFNISEKELLKNEEFIKLFIDSCIGYEYCYQEHINPKSYDVDLDYAFCSDNMIKHPTIKMVDNEFKLVKEICLLYEQKPLKKFYWNIFYKYLIQDSWFFGENNSKQLAQANHIYRTFCEDNDIKQLENLIENNDQKVSEISTNSLEFSIKEKIEDNFIKYFLIHKAKWHKKVAYIDFDYIFKKELFEEFSEDFKFQNLDYLVIMLNNLNGINFLEDKVWQIIDFLKSLNRQFLLKPNINTKILFFNNLEIDKLIWRLKTWNNYDDFNKLRQEYKNLFINFKKTISLNNNYDAKKSRINNDQIIAVANPIVKTNLRAKRVKKDDKNEIFKKLKEISYKYDNTFKIVHKIVSTNKLDNKQKNELEKYANDLINLLKEIEAFLFDNQASASIIKYDAYLMDILKMIYKLASNYRLSDLTKYISACYLTEVFVDLV